MSKFVTKGELAGILASQPASNIIRLPNALSNGSRQLFTNNNRICISNSAGYLTDGVVTSRTSRIKYTTEFAAGNVVLTYADFYSAYSALDTLNANSVTVKAAIEDAGGIIYPVFFRASRTGVCEPGGLLISDPIAVDYASGASFFVRTLVTVTAGQVWHNNYVSVVADGEGAVDNTDSVDSGTIAASASYCYGPTKVLGIPRAGRQRSAALLGDSITQGIGFDAAIKNAGYPARAMHANGIPWINLGVAVERGANFVTLSKSIYRRQQCDGCSNAFWAYGSNDFSSTQGNLSFATVKANALTSWAALNSLGMVVYACTVTMQNTSPNLFWTNLADQVVNSNDAARTAYNDWLRDPSASGAVAQSGGTLQVYIEVADLMESSRNSGKWAIYSPAQTGAITSGTATVLTKTAAGWTVNQWVGYVLSYTSGTLAGQGRLITANTGTTITTATFGSAPSAADGYAITLVNTTDGVHPNATGAALAATATGFANTIY
jgi:hypothetical protein